MIPSFQVGDELFTALARFRVLHKEGNTYRCEVLQSKTHFTKTVTFTMTEELGKYMKKVV
jgi:hypothetical protein